MPLSSTVEEMFSKVKYFIGSIR